MICSVVILITGLNSFKKNIFFSFRLYLGNQALNFTEATYVFHSIDSVILDVPWRVPTVCLGAPWNLSYDINPPTITTLYCRWKVMQRSTSVNCLFWLLTQMCTQGHFWLVFTAILTTLNNTRQCFCQSKTVDSFWPVNVLTARKVWQCLTFKCTR